MAVVEGGNTLPSAWDRLHRHRETIPAARVLTLNAMPYEIRTGFEDAGLSMVYAYLHKPAGTAYTLAATTQEVRIIYDSYYGVGIDNYVLHLDLAGFLDQSTEEWWQLFPRPGLSGVPVPVGDGIELFFTDAEVTGGDTPLDVEIAYRLLRW